jgi:ribulose-phosphate 3-epimerase
MAIEILPTNTCPPDYPELVRRMKAFAAFVPSVHLDISDGKFSPVTSWPYGEGQMEEIEKMADRREVLPLAKLSYYEAHLMVQDPLRVGTLLARVGCRRVLAHVEGFGGSGHTVKEAFSAWRAGGAEQVGLALLIDTDLAALEQYASQCDEVLLMSIPTIGKQGAPFDERIFARVTSLRAKFPNLVIGVDGGVTETTVKQLAAAGATRFGVGSAITKTPDPAAAYAHLMQVAVGA